MGAKFYNGIDGQNQQAANFADATTATALVTLQQLQSKVDGNAWKLPVVAATTTTGTLASAYANGQAVDGVTLATGDRVLVKDQSTGGENGIYIVPASGAPTRATDCDTAAEFLDATCLILGGTVNGPISNVAKAFTQTVKPVVVGTTATIWVQSNSGNVYTALSTGGLQLSSNAFSVKLPGSSGLIADATGLYMTKASTQAVGITSKFAQDSATLTGGSPSTITHNLGTTDVQVLCYLKSTGELIPPGGLQETIVTTNTITIQSGASQSAAAFRIIVIG